MSDSVFRTVPWPQEPPRPGETGSDLRHPFEETNSCLLWRYNTDLRRWEVWWNNGWKKAANTYRDANPSFVPTEPVGRDDDRYVAYEVTWAEPYEEDVDG